MASALHRARTAVRGFAPISGAQLPASGERASGAEERSGGRGPTRRSEEPATNAVGREGTRRAASQQRGGRVPRLPMGYIGGEWGKMFPQSWQAARHRGRWPEFHGHVGGSCGGAAHRR